MIFFYVSIIEPSARFVKITELLAFFDSAFV